MTTVVLCYSFKSFSCMKLLNATTDKDALCSKTVKARSTQRVQTSVNAAEPENSVASIFQW